MENFLSRIHYAVKSLEELPVKDELVEFQWELRSLKLFIMLVMEMEYAGEGSTWDSLVIDIEGLLEEVERITRDQEWEDLHSDVLPKLESLKAKVKEICVDCSLIDVFVYRIDMDVYLNLTLWNLRFFLNNKGGITGVSAPMKKKILEIFNSLQCVKDVYRFSSLRCRDRQKLEELCAFLKGVMNDVACLSVLCWADSKDGDNLSVRLDTLLRKMRHCDNPMVMEMIFGALISSQSSELDKFVVSDIVVNLCNLLLEDLVTPYEDLRHLREGLIFLTSFFMNPPPEKHGEDELMARIRDVI